MENIESEFEGVIVCPVCGNVIQATGEAVVICCGITLPPLETEEADPEHVIHAEITDDEYYVTADHPMTKERVSFRTGLPGDIRNAIDKLKNSAE